MRKTQEDILFNGKKVDLNNCDFISSKEMSEEDWEKTKKNEEKVLKELAGEENGKN